MLAIATLCVYWQVGSNGFINFDDPEYLYNNPHVLQGLTPAGLGWAFSSLEYSNWHPLTWLVHMLACQLFGTAPVAHHLVNLALHAANGVLLFLLLRRMTGAFWQSATVAALFALHPLHVESVAWVAELKDLLSAFCGLLCLLCYARYAGQPRPARYLPVIALFALGLMAKPMLVTLPFLLLLLDYWPLQRMGNSGGCTGQRTPPGRLIAEKLPLVALSALSCGITVYAQQKGMAIRSLAETPLPTRIANALMSYAAYLGKLFWPRDLAVLYPFPAAIPPWEPLLAALLLAAAGTTLFMLRQRHPYLLAGWLWYLITLLPVIGIVRVGMQAMADRYMYLPMAGILIAAVWSIAGLASAGRLPRALPPLLAGAALLLCAITTYRQVGYWHDDLTLYGRTLAITGDNFIIRNNLGVALESRGRLDEAAEQYREALRIAPWYAKSQLNLGVTLRKQGRLAEAVIPLSRALELQPGFAAAHTELGSVMLLQGRTAEAMRSFEAAIALDPGLADAQYNLGLALSRAGRSAEAIARYEKALELKPDDADCLYNLGVEYARQGRSGEAVRLFTQVVRLNPDRELTAMARQGIDQALRQQSGSR